jgi:ProP effector
MGKLLGQQDREAVVVFHKLMAKNHPKTFSPPVAPATRLAPLKVGIHKDLVERYPEVPRKTIRSFVNGYVYHPAYLRLCGVARSARIDLDGQAAGVVTDEEAQHALALMEKHSAERTARQPKT